MQKAVTLLILLLLSPLSAAATSSLQGRTVDSNHVMLESFPYPLSTDQTSAFEVKLQNANQTPIQNKDIRIRLLKDDIRHYSSISLTTSDSGTASFQYRFHEPGQYQVEVGFKPDNQLTTTRFNVTVRGVAGQRREKDTTVLLVSILAIAVGFILGIAQGFQQEELVSN